MSQMKKQQTNFHSSYLSTRSLLLLLFTSTYFAFSCTYAVAATEEISLIREDCTGYSNCFTSLAQWEEAKEEDLVTADKIAIARIEGTWSSADTTKVRISGWTTGPDNYIKILTASDSRHQGLWDDTKHRLVVDTTSWPRTPLYIDANHVTVQGLQIAHNGLDTSGSGLSSNSGGKSVVEQNLIKNTGTAQTGIHLGGSDQIVVRNNIIYDFTAYGIRVYSNDVTASLCNNTVYNIRGYSWSSGIGVTSGVAKAINNLVQNVEGNDYSGSFDSASNYNLSSDNSTSGGAEDIPNASVTFLDPDKQNFHLSTSDLAARNRGFDLSSDFSNDIDTDLRQGRWDIGADDIYDTSAPLLSEISPVTTPTNDPTPLYEFQSSEEGTISGNCSYQTTEAVKGINQLHFTQLENGTYSGCTLRVTDPDGNISNSLTINAFTIDTTIDLTPPTITAHVPGALLPQGTTETTLTVTTDEPALCRISPQTDTSYNNMTPMQSADLNHDYPVSGLHDLANYNYYVKCKDTSPQENINPEDYTISFQIRNDPRVIISDHPRIWLTPERLARLRQDAANETDKFLRLRDNVANEGGLPVVNVINNLLMYQVWHDHPEQAKRDIAVQRAARAMEITDSYIQQRYSDRNKAAFYMMCVALVYDWLYDYPPFQSKKQSYIDWYTLTTDPTQWLGRSQFSIAFETEDTSYDVNKDQSWHNYHLLGQLTLYIIGAATYGDNSEAQNWIDLALSWYNNTREGLTFNGSGGGSPEDDHYWSESINYLGKFLHAVKSASGADLSREFSHYKDRLSYSRFVSWPRATDYYGEPAWNYVYHGDANTHINSVNHRQRMAKWMLIDLFPEEEEAKYLQSFLTQSPVTRTYNRKFSGEEFLWAIDTREVLPYTESSLSHLATGTGRFFARQDWTETSTHIEFQCGDHFEYHQHYAQGHFGLFKHEALVTDGGKYDDTSRTHARNYHYRTIAHNTLLVYDDREGSGDSNGAWSYMRGSEHGVNDGGQLVSALYDEHSQLIKRSDESVPTVADWHAAGLDSSQQPIQNVYDSGEILHYENQDDYVYVNGDATNSYHTWKVSHFDRSMVYLRTSDVLIIFDRVSVPNYTNKKRMLFHLQGEPILASTGNKIQGLSNPYGGVWQHDNTSAMEMTFNNAKLFYRALLPQSTNIVKIGGPNASGQYDQADSFEYWVPTNGNDLAQGGTNWQSVDEKTKNEKEYAPWRIEVSPSVAQVDDVFLHLLFPRDTSVTTPPAADLITSQDNTMSGTLINKEDAPQIVLFPNNSSGDLVHSIDYSIDFDSNLIGKHLLVGVESGSYDIFLDNTLRQTVTATPENTLYFETVGSGNFTISNSSERLDHDDDSDVDGKDLADLAAQGQVTEQNTSSFANFFGKGG